MRRAMLLQTATFLLLLVAVLVGGITLHRQNGHVGRVANHAAAAAATAKHAAAVAKIAAKGTAEANTANHSLRSQQIAALHAQSVKDCADIHKLASVFETYLSRAITAPSLTLPDLTPAQKKALKRVGIKSLASQKSLLAQIDAADCKSVKRLPSSQDANS